MATKKVKRLNAIRRISSVAKRTIESAIEVHKKYKNSYFWSPGGNSSSRRYNEDRFPGVDFEIMTAKGLVQVIFDYSESCKNVYYSMSVYLNDVKKDIRLLKKMVAA